MARGFLYLVAVMDWHSRYVLAWRLSNTMEAGFCAEALEEALTKGRPEVFNTDQGSQFTSLEFTQVLQEHGVRISMDGKGRYQDNIFVERLWRTVKYEEVYLKAYASVLEAQKGLADYFRFCNGLRPHQALGYRTPAEVFYGEQEAVAEESNRRRCSPEQGTRSLAGAPGFPTNQNSITLARPLMGRLQPKAKGLVLAPTGSPVARLAVWRRACPTPVLRWTPLFGQN